jgi:AraC-like DNA-binding protein
LAGNGKHGSQYETSIAGWSFAIADALASYGLEPTEIFRRAGIAIDEVDSPSARLPVDSVQQVWQFAHAHTDDCFGIRVAQHLTPASLHAMGLSLWCSNTLRELFERYIRYRCVLSHMHFCELIDEGESVRLSLVDERRIKSEITNDAATAFFLGIARRLYREDFSPRELHITRSLGEERRDIEEFFQTEIVENAGGYCVLFAAEDLEAPLRFANPELATQLDLIIERYIAEFGLISEYMLRVRTEIHRLIGLGSVSLELVADNLNVTARTLQRRLASEKSSYNILLDQVRKQLALEYSAAPKASATEIAFRLGFTDSGSFGRSFRRWTGQSFSEYRQTRRQA